MSTVPVPQAVATSASRTAVWALVPLGIALNLSVGTLVHALRLPIYLDAVGTIIITLLAGVRAGIVTGVGSFLLAGILTNPVLPWFSGTQAAIALFTSWASIRGGFRSYQRVVIAGIGLGIVAGVVSAPVIVYLFGGITGAGASMVTAFLLATGKTLVKAVILSGLACEPLDKTLQCLLALWIVRGLPPRLLAKAVPETLRGRFAPVKQDQ